MLSIICHPCLSVCLSSIYISNFSNCSWQDRSSAQAKALHPIVVGLLSPLFPSDGQLSTELAGDRRNPTAQGKEYFPRALQRAEITQDTVRTNRNTQSLGNFVRNTLFLRIHHTPLHTEGSGVSGGKETGLTLFNLCFPILLHHGTLLSQSARYRHKAALRKMMNITADSEILRKPGWWTPLTNKGKIKDARASLKGAEPSDGQPGSLWSRRGRGGLRWEFRGRKCASGQESEQHHGSFPVLQSELSY